MVVGDQGATVAIAAVTRPLLLSLKTLISGFPLITADRFAARTGFQNVFSALLVAIVAAVGALDSRRNGAPKHAVAHLAHGGRRIVELVETMSMCERRPALIERGVGRTHSDSSGASRSGASRASSAVQNELNGGPESDRRSRDGDQSMSEL